MGRFSLAGSLWVVAFVALGFAALRSGDDAWLGVAFLLTVALLCAGVVGSVVERKAGGVWWLGFALFGWTYFALGLIPGTADPSSLPSRAVARWVFDSSNGQPNGLRPGFAFGPAGAPVPANPNPVPNWATIQARRANAFQIARWLFVLAFARAGATVSCVFTKGWPGRKRPGGGG